MSDTATLEITEIDIQSEDPWRVIFHNDNKTSMEFVISLLIHIFKKTQQEAIYLTMLVHNEGLAVVAEYTNYGIAETKVSEADHIIKEFGFPLKITLEQ